MNSKPSLITCSLDYDAVGLHHGILRIPYSHDRSAYGFIPVPLWQVKDGEGPTVLLTAGNHGDEYEGPVALMRLLHEGAFDTVKGRVIVVPALNVPAYAAGKRNSPIDHVNLNRAFPGKRDGTVTEMLAHYIETVLMPMADYAIDIHSGGSSLNYLPTVMTFRVDSVTEQDALDRVVEGFNPPRALVMDLGAEDRTIMAAARRNDVVFMTGEFGGGAAVDPAGVEIVASGIIGSLAAIGVLPARPDGPVGSFPRLEVKPAEHYIYAPNRGIFEPSFTLGSDVCAGDLAGRLYDQEQPQHAPAAIFWSGSGCVICTRTFGLVEAGDCLAHLAEPVG